VWQKLTEMLKDREPAPQSSTYEMESEPAKWKIALLLMDDEAPSTDKTLDRYRAELSISIEACPLQWWSAHKSAHAKLAHIVI